MKISRNSKALIIILLFCWAPFCLNAQVIFNGDGSSEPGFVPPPEMQKPPPPPANMAGSETVVPYPPPPAQPQSRSEKKNPPSPPVMFVKIKSQYGLIDWASRPNDLNNLLQGMKEKVDVNFASECLYFSEINTDPEKNPIIYRSGHFRFKLKPEERKRLREYLLNGGMLILNTGMGSKPFFDSAQDELTAIFPELKIQRLSADHPIFHSYYDLGQVEYRQGVRKTGYTSSEPLFYGITVDCRTVAVISRWCMASGWDAVNDDSIMGYSVDSSQKLGINLMSYATAQRAWAKNASHAMKFVDEDQTKAGKTFVAQIVYAGEWKTRHNGLSILLQQFNKRTDIPVKFGHQDIALSDSKIYDAPLIYLTGHDQFQLNAAEIKNLRDYLLKGGFLLAEACCGRKGFDASFRREIKKVLPEQTLTPVPAESQLFSLPNQTKMLGVTPAFASTLGNKTSVAPQLLGIELNGQYAVMYSPYAMSGGWEMAQNPYAIGYDDASSLLIGENILMYAITH